MLENYIQEAKLALEKNKKGGFMNLGLPSGESICIDICNRGQRLATGNDFLAVRKYEKGGFDYETLKWKKLEEIPSCLVIPICTRITSKNYTRFK